MMTEDEEVARAIAAVEAAEAEEARAAAAAALAEAEEAALRSEVVVRSFLELLRRKHPQVRQGRQAGFRVVGWVRQG
jgi:hypothetical protein